MSFNLFFGFLFAQDYEWEIDKIKKREEKKKIELDSLMVHLKNKWEISLNYGQWFFNNKAKSTEEELFFLPQNMGVWSFTLSRHFSERIAVNVKVGIQKKQIKPEQPNIISIIGSGGDVDIEGSGAGFVPIGIGMDYFFLKERFHPYAGLKLGIVLAQSQYTLVEGNVSSSIDRTEYMFNGSARFYEMTSGFMYRLSKNVQTGININYVNSTDFEEKVGGYSRYNGFTIAGIFAIVF